MMRDRKEIVKEIAALVIGSLLVIVCSLFTGCQRLPYEVEWHENGQMKAIRYYKRGGMNIKVFCYDTDNHNQTVERGNGE